MQKLSVCLLVSVLLKGSFAVQCSVDDIPAITSMDTGALQVCMGTTGTLSKYTSCLKEIGVFIPFECANCMYNLTIFAGTSREMCEVDPEGSLCQHCRIGLRIRTLRCFDSDAADFTASNDSSEYVEISSTSAGKSALIPNLAVAAGIVAIALFL